MATLILGAVGSFLGGPIGKAVGAFVGREIDRGIFAPAPREGPRLGDLSIQTSTYGAAIPKLFGKVRASGTLIWATDLKETRTTRSNGKAAPKTNVYSYSASFAVLLSARRIVRLGRIWADGNLLRGEAGDFKVQTGFRLYLGGEDQSVDPLIAAAEGIGQTPAYRGLAYAVFENCQLGDFGNRIPSLSFEVIADEGPVATATMIATLTGAGALAGSSPTIDGVAATGDSVRGVAEVLNQALPLTLVDTGAALLLSTAAPRAVMIDSKSLGTSRKESRTAKLPIERRSVLSVPETLSIAYYDAAREYQPGLQSARRDGGARRAARIDLPATLTAERARAIAEAQLTTRWAQRVSAKVRLPWRFLALKPGDYVQIAGSSDIWRVAGVTLEHLIVSLDLVPLASIASASIADAGRPVVQLDSPHGPTTLVLLDLPPIGDAAPRDVTLAIAAAGASPGWRRAALLTSNDGGASWTEFGTTALPATMGTSLSSLGGAQAALIDRLNKVDVQLLSSAMTLTDADMPALLAGANLAMLGGEAIQFGRAEPLGAGRWRLSVLLRGRRGTEAAIAGHGLGEAFVLLDQATLVVLDPALAQPGLQIMGVGIAEGATPPIAAAVTTGRSLQPLSPVQLRVVPLPSGDSQISWIRRSREGWAWRDGVDVPIGEESLRFRITQTLSNGTARTAEVDSESYLYNNADRAADVARGATSITFAIQQIGARGLSLPLSITIPLI
jgi:Putative phage tail protein